MAIANIKVTLLCPIEKVWNKLTNLNDFVWRSDLTNIRIINDNTFLNMELKLILRLQNVLNIKAGHSK